MESERKIITGLYFFKEKRRRKKISSLNGFLVFSFYTRKSPLSIVILEYFSREELAQHTQLMDQRIRFFECISLSNSHEKHCLFALRIKVRIFSKEHSWDSSTYWKTFHLKVFKWTADIDSVEFLKFLITSVLKNMLGNAIRVDTWEMRNKLPENFAFQQTCVA